MTTSTPTTGATTFADFGVDKALCDALAEAGIINPFPIQELTLPLALSGADIIGQARTGTGKTLAFGLPLLQRVDRDAPRGSGPSSVQVLAIVPTRELCVQVAEDLTKASAKLDIDVVAVYGGKAMDPQIDALTKGAQVVVGTPGRLLDLMRRGLMDLSSVRGLVLDEADEMLDLGFLPDVEQLIEACNTDRQTLLFSATMPSAVVALARRYMDKPTFLRADVEQVHIAPQTKQHFFSCHRMDKPAVLARILQAPDRGLCVVFSRTKRMCDILADELRERGINAAPIHSDLRQEAREKALTRFREGKIDVLVATEVAARGLDIDDVTHVVNYDCPDDEKMYLHRIGRTGRAGAAGVAVTLVVWNELARLEMIKKALEIDEPTHEVFSTSPILDELFALPTRDERGPRVITKSDVDRGRAAGRSGSKGGGRSAPPREARSTTTDEAPSDEQKISRRRSKARTDDEEKTSPTRGARTTAGSSDDDGTPRRRTRRRTTGDQAPKPSSARAAGAKGSADARDGEPGPDAKDAGETADTGRPRTRRRTRTTQDRTTPSTARATSTRRSRDAEDDESSTTRTRTRTRRTGSSSDAKSSDASGSDAKGEARGGRQGTKGDSPRSRQKESQTSSGDARKPSGRGGRGGGGGRSKGRSRSGASRESSGDQQNGGNGGGRQRRQRVSSDEARGEGTPRLRRPLEVSHLP